MAYYVIIAIIFAAFLYIAVAGAIGMYINGEKGRSRIGGFIIGAFLPVIGWVALGINRPSNEYLLNEAHNRELISKSEFDKTIEFAIKKDKEK